MTYIKIEVFQKEGEFEDSASHLIPLKDITDWHPFQAEEIIQELLKTIESKKPKTVK